MKNTYTQPNLEIVGFTATDVLSTSLEPEELTVEINGKLAISYGSAKGSVFEL
ncbi:MAG: hypothetical protein IKU61_05065 [Clostridia bacterium]|nr:hypothetical protein [Clostridia bacterium]